MDPALILHELAELRHALGGDPGHPSSDPNILHDRLIELTDLVSSLAVCVQEAQAAACRANNVASCLANGIKPD